MNREEAMKRSDDALAELALALSQGKSEALVRYLDTVSAFHHYSFRNCMLIAMQKPDATLVAGFRRWKELGRWVKKDEHGIAILAPLVYRRKKDDAGDADREATQDADPDKVRALRGFKAVRVFDVSQTDGKELPKLDMAVLGDPGERVERLEAVVRSKGIELVYEQIQGGALGTSYGGRIAVVPNLPKAESFAVLVHELAHELLHRGDRRKDTTKTIRETEAEAVAYVVCRTFGLQCSQKSADYIQLYFGDKELLSQSLELIRDVAAGIITELEEESSKEVQHAA
jgi:antirestriction protein ArdC